MARHAFGFCGIALSLLSACSTLPPPLPVSAATQLMESYTLGPGDRLRLIVFGEAQMSQEYNITNEGAIAVPLIGDVSVLNKTVPQAEKEIADRLVSSNYLKEPKVSIEIISYRQYFILGEAARPGAYPYSAGLNISQAIATAGGFTYRANTRRVFITRTGNSAEYTVDLKTRNIPIRPGDVIRIGERYF